MYDELLSSFAFNSNMRRYIMGGERDDSESWTKEATAAAYMADVVQKNDGVLKQDKLNYHAFGSGRYVGAWVQVIGLQSAVGKACHILLVASWKLHGAQ
jgi:hypothetical protein